MTKIIHKRCGLILILFVCNALNWTNLNALTLRVEDREIVQGQTIEVLIKCEDFVDLIGIQTSIQWDPDVLNFIEFGEFNLHGLTQGNFGISTDLGIMTMSWEDSLLNGVTLSDGSTLFVLQFQVLGEPGAETTVDFADTPTPREAVDRAFSTVEFLTQGGTLSILDLTPPTLSEVADISDALEDLPANISFIVGDSEDGPNNLGIQVTSNNSNLFPNENLVVSGTGSDRLLTMTPSPNQSGSAEITLLVTDSDELSVTRTFSVVVLPVNDPPVASGLPEEVVLDEDGQSTIDWTLEDVDTPLSEIEISLASSNTDLVTSDGLNITGTAPHLSLIIQPLANAFGEAEITVTLVDGDHTLLHTLALIVHSVPDAPTLTFEENSLVMDEDITLQVPFIVGDAEDDPSQLMPAVLSSDNNLFPQENLIFMGGGETRYLQLNPSADAFGQCTLTLMVEDSDGLSTTVELQVNVQSVNDLPILDDFNLTPLFLEVPEGGAVLNLTLQVHDVDSDIAEIRATFDSPSQGPGLELQVTSPVPVEGDLSNGLFQLDLNLPGSAETGAWLVQEIRIMDVHEGETVLSGEELELLGYLDQFRVVSGDEPKITLGDKAGAMGGRLIVPVTVDNFVDLTGLQFSMHWDPEVIQFVGLQSLNLPGLTSANFGLEHADEGTLAVSWSDNTLEGVSVPDETLIFGLEFEVIGQPEDWTAIRVIEEPTRFEVVDANVEEVFGWWADGSVSVLTTVPLSGHVRFWNGDTMVSNAQVEVEGGSQLAEILTGTNGEYALEVSAGEDYMVTVSKANDDPASQGVSTLDILLMRRHILNPASDSTKLNPYGLLAADVNRSDSVTTLDILLVRRLILNPVGNPTFISGQDVWRFVPAELEFSNPEEPWNHEIGVSLPGLMAEKNNVDFIAIKLGDVNGSWAP